MKYKKWLMCLVLSSMLTGCGQTTLPATSLANTSLPPRIMTFSPTDCTNVTEIPLSECTVLIALYTQTNGANWINNSGWTTPTPCSRPFPWIGITCAAGHVTEIFMAHNGLVGALPKTLNTLTHLKYLDLSGNRLSGSILSLGSLTSLETLILNANQLSGSIPLLSGLTSLQWLDLSGNNLNGSIPLLGGLSSLQYLNLGGNNLSGSIPSLSGLARLQFLSLNNNQLSGPVPANITVTNAYHLYLCGGLNNLTPPDALTNTWIAAHDTSWTAGVGCTAATFTPTITLTPTPS